MQKFYTKSLYIAGLYVVANDEYINSDDYLMTGRFLRWVVVNNVSDDLSTEFIDIDDDVKYYSSGLLKGDVYINLESLYSFTNLSSKSKLSKEEIFVLLDKYKNDKLESKIKNMRIIYDVIVKLIDSIGLSDAYLIIDDLLSKYGFDGDFNDFLNELHYNLDYDFERYSKVRNR